MTSARKTIVARAHRSKRRGTVLIFVIGVLVLMALAATAYLTTARVDRATTKQNEFNTQVDLLMEGLKKAAIAKITTGDETAPTGYRQLVNGTPATGQPTKGSYFADRPGIDGWLANRAPYLADATVAMNTTTNPPTWASLSAGILGIGQFEEPTTGSIIPTNDIRGLYRNMFPTTKNGKAALAFSATPGTTYHAADADGDGIADSGFTRLPVGKVNGLTYYVAYRIVDHNSAINATTAYSRDEDFDTNDVALPTTTHIAAPVGLFTTSVGLREMLSGGAAERNALRDYKLGAAPPYASVIDSTAPTAYQDYRSIGDMLFHGLNRRTENPATGFAGFGLNDQISLSYRNGAVRDSNASQSQVEKTLQQSVYTSAKSVAYKPNDVTTWFNDLYNDVAPATPTTRRPYVTTWNPTSSVVRGIPLQTLASAYPETFTPAVVPAVREWITVYGGASAEQLPQRASLNSSDFPTLWRAYLNVMMDPALAGAPAPEEAHLGINPTTAGFSDVEATIIRAAQAAVNTIDLRDDDEDITVRQFQLRKAADGTVYNINVFGSERQPFITQSVFFDNGTSGVSHDYGAIELYNPYETPLDINGWELVQFDRSTAPPLAVSRCKIGTDTPVQPPIPPRGYMVIQSSAPPGAIAAVVQTATPSPATRGGAIIVTGPPMNTIRSILNPGPKDLLLMRTRRVDDTASADVTSTPNTVEPDETASIANLVPVDQVSINDPGSGTARVFWRGRPTAAATNFKCVYERDPTPAGWTVIDPAGVAPPVVTLGADNTIPAADFPTIQIAADNTPIPYPEYAGNRYGYPYAGFGRLGDMSHVPFIGGQTVFDSTGALIDSASISVDAFRADDGGVANNNVEAVGKFDVENYAWARDVFDFFTVINHPKDEYSYAVPKSDNVSEVAPLTGFNFNESVPSNTPGETPPFVIPATPLPDMGPVQGLININTAPAKVLAMLPWLPTGADVLTYNADGSITLAPNTINDNEDIAKAIVHYREFSEIPNNGIDDNADGQVDEVVLFNSITDLLRIPAMVAVRTAILAAGEPDDLDGDLTPVDHNLQLTAGITTDGARNDLEENTLLLSRVSNLITTRSDTFTVYILLQGYRDGGSAAAELVVQRRAAIIVDRSKLEPQVTEVNVSRVWAE